MENKSSNGWKFFALLFGALLAGVVGLYIYIHDAPRDSIIQAEDNLHIIFTDGSLYIHIRLVTHLPIRKDDAVLDLGLSNSSFPHIRRNIY